MRIDIHLGVLYNARNIRYLITSFTRILSYPFLTVNELKNHLEEEDNQ